MVRNQTTMEKNLYMGSPIVKYGFIMAAKRPSISVQVSAKLTSEGESKSSCHRSVQMGKPLGTNVT